MEQSAPKSDADTVEGIVRAEALCDAFEEAWRAGTPLTVEQFLRAHQLDPNSAPADLVRDLARIEAEYRLRAGEHVADAAGTRRFVPRAADTAPPAAGESAAPPRIPGYEIVGELGRGGMGVVYKAWQVAAPRLVALKVVRAGSHASAAERERLRIEASAITRLQHPCVVQVFEVGECGGLPFFSMELCPGGNLAQQLGGNPLPAREAAALVERLARGVQAAHEAGVVHRDLKPANVLLAADGTLRVTDFGLAKLTDAGDAATLTGLVVGTPSYMAPEQAAGRAKEAGPTADVYALGAVLYECLTGRPPFKGASVADTLLMVTTQEPVSVHALVPDVPRDLEAVCFKCMEKAPADRYATAAELADDLRAFLAYRPTRARPVGPLGRLRRWSKRNRAAAWALVAVTAALLTGSAVAMGFGIDARAARDLAKSRAGELDEANVQLRGRVEQLRLESYPDEIRLAYEGWRTGDLAGARAILARHIPAEGQTDLRGFEWRYLDACLRDTERVLARHDSPLLTVDVSPDGKLVASGDASGVVKVTELATGREVRSVRYSNQEVTCVRFSPNGKLLATAGQDQTVRLWSVADGLEVRCLREHTQTVMGVAWAPNSRRIASAGRDHFLKTWDVSSGERLLNIEHPEVVRCVAWSRTNLISTGCAEPDLMNRVWDANTGNLIYAKKATGGTLAQAFKPNGYMLASGGYSHIIQVVLPGQSLHRCILISAGQVWALAFHPEQRYVVAGQSGRFQLWDVELFHDQSFPIRTREVNGIIRGMAFTADGRHLVTAVREPNEVRVQSVPALLGHTRLRYKGTEVAVSPASDTVAVRAADNTVTLQGFLAAKPAITLPMHIQGSGTRLTFTHRGEELLAKDEHGRVTAWDVATASHTRVVLGRHAPYWSVAASPDEKWLAALGLESGTYIARLGTGELVKILPVDAQKVDRRSLAFTPDGSLLAVSVNTVVTLWQVGSWEQLARWDAQGSVLAVAFSPDGRTLATAGEENGVILWDVPSGTQIARLRGHEGAVGAVAFSPDGRTLATAGEDRTVRLWHVATRRELFSLVQHPVPLRWVRFASNTRLLVSGSSEVNADSDVLVFPPVE